MSFLVTFLVEFFCVGRQRVFDEAQKIYPFSSGEARNRAGRARRVAAEDGWKFLGFSVLFYTLTRSHPVRQLHQYPLSVLLGFLIGSLPTAYLLVKWRKKVDIRNQGSGNVGAMNVMEVTASPALGITVLVIDIFKGVAAVLLAGRLIGPEFWVMGAGGVGAVLGHNYSPWISFRGGRGLATAYGICLALGWIVGVVWIALFGVTYLVRRDLHVGNIFASLLLPPAVVLMPDGWLAALLPGRLPGEVFGLSVCICLLVLLGHLDIMKRFFSSSQSKAS